MIGWTHPLVNTGEPLNGQYREWEHQSTGDVAKRKVLDYVFSETDMDNLKPSLKYAPLGTLGSLCIAYGLRMFLRATGGGYYCCDHGMFQVIGTVIALVGWTALFTAVLGAHRGVCGE